MGPLAWHSEYAFERDTDGSSVKIIRTSSLLDELIEIFRTGDASSVPAFVERKLRPRSEKEYSEDWPCRQAVGILMWLAIMSKPDMAQVVRDVAGHASDLSR